MYKEARNLKPGDRVTCTVEFTFEVITAPKVDEAGCRLTLRPTVASPFEPNGNGTQTLDLPSPSTRLRYLGNIDDIEQQISRLTEQKAKLQGASLPAARTKQSPQPAEPEEPGP